MSASFSILGEPFTLVVSIREEHSWICSNVPDLGTSNFTCVSWTSGRSGLATESECGAPGVKAASESQQAGVPPTPATCHQRYSWDCGPLLCGQRRTIWEVVIQVNKILPYKFFPVFWFCFFDMSKFSLYIPAGGLKPTFAKLTLVSRVPIYIPSEREVGVIFESESQAEPFLLWSLISLLWRLPDHRHGAWQQLLGCLTLNHPLLVIHCSILTTYMPLVNSLHSPFFFSG